MSTDDTAPKVYAIDTTRAHDLSDISMTQIVLSGYMSRGTQRLSF